MASVYEGEPLSWNVSRHVCVRDCISPSLPFYSTPDILLATLLTLLTLFGLPANLISLCYFLSKKGHSFATILYRAICLLDISITIIALPVIVCLASGRHPMWFGNWTFCVGWAVVFNFLQLASPFSVLLLSVSRTIAIVKPFYTVNRRAALLATIGYMVIAEGYELILTLFKGYFETEYQYDIQVAYCYYLLNNPGWKVFDETRSAIITGVMPIIIAVSFGISIWNFLTQGTVADDLRERHRVSITMTAFTGIFLVCNLPNFVNYVLYVVTINTDDYPGTIYRNSFMYNYSWPISEILGLVLNSALNPILYLCRMKGLKNWIEYKVYRRDDYEHSAMTAKF